MNARSDGRPKAIRRRFPYGVTWRQRRKPYLVKFKRNKRTVNVGSFTTLEEATTMANNFIARESAQ